MALATDLRLGASTDFLVGYISMREKCERGTVCQYNGLCHLLFAGEGCREPLLDIRGHVLPQLLQLVLLRPALLALLPQQQLIAPGSRKGERTALLLTRSSEITND